ncbi:hypothetical protein BpJC7_01730 [Weizmannia acidilactici]|uniref:AB hydrolase-1 domain-containing protein n=1 Tax=Weizmannia acidilactici TaxID=2607726 RepID=A0A5J4JEK8_9BACI|nr:alpha/beta hydrolase [Weizmannia acidilactici]GER68870.1 hypothetical protein BpJC7_01730 [Weizmannia acidilactici]
MPYVQTGYGQVYCSIRQKQPNSSDGVMVLVHAAMCDHHLFDDLIPHLEQHFQLILYDLRGHGKTQAERGAEDYTLDTFVEDLKVLLETLQLNKIRLAGIGFGALIAAKYARLYESSVEHLVLMSLPCYPPHIGKQVRQFQVQISNNGRFFPAMYFVENMTMLFPEDPAVQKLKNCLEIQKPELFMRLAAIIAEASPVEDLRAIKIPVLILSGDMDCIFPPHYLFLHLYAKPNIFFQTVNDAKMLVTLDNPKTTASRILSFILPDTSKVAASPFFSNIRDQTIKFTKVIYKQAAKKAQWYKQIRVEFLDRFRVFINGKEIVDGWNRRSAKQILIYLVFHQTASREQICEALWPDVPLQQARKNLRVYLSYLKKLVNIKEQFITMDRENVFLSGNITSDTLDLQDLIKEAKNEPNEGIKWRKCQQIMTILKPGFLTAIYDDWFMEIRETIENDLINLVLWCEYYLDKHYDAEKSIQFLSECMSVIDKNEKIYDRIIEQYRRLDDDKNMKKWMKMKYDVLWLED